jgi:hypothetical protein
MIFALLLGMAPAEELPAYDDALRCAALTGAQLDIEVRDTPAWHKAWDEAMFWGMALSERGRKDGMTADRFEVDLKTAVEQLAVPLRAGNARLRAEHAACVKRVPPLKP